MRKRLKYVLKLIRSARIIGEDFGEYPSEFYDLTRKAIAMLATIILRDAESDSVMQMMFDSIKKEIEQHLFNELGHNVSIELTGFNAVEADEIDDALDQIANVHGYKFNLYKLKECWSIGCFLVDECSRRRFERLLSENLSGKCEIKVVK